MIGKKQGALSLPTQQSNHPKIHLSVFQNPCPSVVDLIGNKNKRIALNVPSFPESKQHE
jgi:hypothetical protein